MNELELPRNWFYVVMAVDIAGWLVLLLFPRRPWANFWIAGLIVPLVLSLISIFFLIAFFLVPPALKFESYRSLDAVYAMFANRGLLLVAWTNLAIMDLAVAAWMVRMAARVKIPYALVLPCLLLTFIFAGFGFTLFAALAGVGGRWNAIAKAEGIQPTDSDPVDAQPLAA
jgi:hypothetical protein